jgi:hypothetical protein
LTKRITLYLKASDALVDLHMVIPPVLTQGFLNGIPPPIRDGLLKDLLGILIVDYAW